MRELSGDTPRIVEIAPEKSRVARFALGVKKLRRVGAYAVRFPDYMLRVRSCSYDVNHILDHAYGQLTYALDARRTVVTCHDIYPLKLWRGEINGLPRRRLPPVTVRLSLAGMLRAAAVIAPSEATRCDVANLGFPEEHIFVVPHGVESQFRPYTSDELAAYPLAGPGVRYILTVDTGAAYKNARASIEVLARVAAAFSDPVMLVRLGRPLADAERRLAHDYGIADRILELGVVAEADLPQGLLALRSAAFSIAP